MIFNNEIHETWNILNTIAELVSFDGNGIGIKGEKKKYDEFIHFKVKIAQNNSFSCTVFFLFSVIPFKI